MHITKNGQLIHGGRATDCFVHLYLANHRKDDRGCLRESVRGGSKTVF